MTSQKSFINNFGFAYRTGLRDNAFVAFIQLIFSSIAFVFIPSKILFQKVTTDQSTGKMVLYNIKDQYKFVLTNGMEYTRYLYIAGFIIIGILMGIVTFKFMTGKKTMNVYYSLGIKRTHLFTAKFLSGLTLIGVATFLPIFVGFLLNVIKIGFSSNLLLAALFYFVGLFSVSALAFSLTAVVFSAVGTAFEGLVFSAIIISMPSIIINSVQSFIESLVPGSPYGISFGYEGVNVSKETLLHKFSNANPFMYLSKGLYQFMSADKKGQLVDYDSGKTIAWSAPDFKFILMWLVVATALFICAMFVYKNRKAEIGGFIGKNKVLNFICTFTLGFYGFVSAYSLGFSLPKATRIIISFCVFAIIYIVLDLILIRNFKEFVKGFYKLPIHLGIAALIFVFFATGYFGAANKTPNIEKISNIKISSGYTSYSDDINTDSYSYSFSSINLSGCYYPSGDFQTEKDKQQILDIHSALAKMGMHTIADVNYNSNDIYPMYIKIVYTLSNGKQIKRAYYGFNQEIYNMLLELDKSDYRTARLKDAFFGEYKTEDKYTEDDIKAYREAFQNNDNEYIYNYYFNSYKAALQNDTSSVMLYNKSGIGTEISLSTEQRKELLTHLYNDITKMTPQQLYNPSETYGVLTFSAVPYSFASYDTGSNNSSYSSYEVSSFSSSAESDEDTNMYNTHSASQPDFYLTPDMKETVEYLKSIKVFDQAMNNKQNITEVRLTKISSNNKMYISNNFGYNLEMGKEVLFQNSYVGGSYQYKSSDKKIIEKLYSVSLMRKTVDIANDYYVWFVTGGETSYGMIISGNALPDDIKQSVDESDIVHSYD